MRQQHAFRVARAARRVLNEGGIRRPRCAGQCPGRDFTKLFDRDDVLERGHCSAEQPRNALRSGERDQHSRAGVPEDPALPVRILLDLVRPGGWINWDRIAALGVYANGVLWRR